MLAASRHTWNVELLKAQKELEKRRTSYESGFKNVSALVPAPVKISLAYVELESPEGNAIIALHRELWGEGKSPEEAINDWQNKLDSQPQSGEFLHWRVTPEIDWQYDFAKQEPLWRVYARFAIV